MLPLCYAHDRQRSVKSANGMVFYSKRRFVTTRVRCNAGCHMSRLTALLPRVTIAVATLSVFIFWLVYADNVRVKAARAARLAAEPLPILLNGFVPQFDGAVSTQDSASFMQNGRRPSLIIAVADSCRFSSDIVPAVESWIDKSMDTNYSAILVSFDGTQHLKRLAAALQRRGIPHVEWTVIQRQQFVSSSGISATPRLVAVDTSGRARLVADRLTSSFVDEVASLVRDEAP